MARTATRIAAVIVLLLCTGTCSHSSDVVTGSGRCNDGLNCNGNYSGRLNSTWAYPGCTNGVVFEIDGDVLSFSEFEGECGGSITCGWCTASATVTVMMDAACQFNFEAGGSGSSGPTTLTVSGNLDQQSCTVSGTYDLHYGSCCDDSGSWSAGL